MFKNNIKSIWRYNDIKIVFSEPSIQAPEKIVDVEDAEDILYYYYTLTVYRKCDKKWKEVLCANVWDFPQILDLERVLEMLNKSSYDDNSWQVDKSDDGSTVWYQKSYTLSGIVPEDFYTIEKEVRIWDGDMYECFNLTVGAGKFDSDTVTSVVLRKLKPEEITGFIDVVKNFIKKSIEHHNQIQRERIAADKQARIIKDGKMYEYSINTEHFTVNFDVLDSIYTVGDTVELTILEKKDGKDVFTHYNNCRIVNIEESNIGKGGYITITGGTKDYEINETELKIPVELIVHSFADIAESEKLSYNKKQCMEEFTKIMTKEEQKEFAEMPVGYLVNKWTYAIACRTWMFRSEHGFKNPKKTIKKVIKKIKKRCNEEDEKKYVKRKTKTKNRRKKQALERTSGDMSCDR